MKELKDIPKKVKDWAYMIMPCTKSYMIYTRKGRNVKAFCTTCGKTICGINRSETLEDVAKVFMYPMHNTPSECPACKARGEWKAQGRCKPVYHKYIDYMFGQRIKDDFVFRLCTINLTIYKNIKSEITHNEWARVYLSKGKKPEKYYHYRGYNGETYWSQSNFGAYWGGVGIRYDYMFPETMKEIKRTPMFKYAAERKGIDPLYYYSAYSRYPDMEMVQKLGMEKLERAMMCQHGMNLNPKGKTIWARLRIEKDRMQDLREKKGDLDYLHIFQQEKREKHRFTKDEIEREIYLRQFQLRERNILRTAIEHASFEKFKNYKEKQFGVMEYPSEWRFRDLYINYIRMRIEGGYDLNNDVILFPKDLKRKHDELVELARLQAEDERRKKLAAEWIKIEEKYPKLYKKFYYANGDFFIRPAKNAVEIADEGYKLHHCVGTGKMYYEKHCKGESFILFLRRADQPEEPFATIEISGNKILQWYEAHDEKPDEEILQPWLDAYTKHLGAKKNKKKTA